ncbi:MAG: hypothetical protein ACLFUC_07565 [Bacteroidales bacterium]
MQRYFNELENRGLIRCVSRSNKPGKEHEISVWDDYEQLKSGVDIIKTITDYKVKRFKRYLKRRENKLYGSCLMNASINVVISSVNKFFEYLRQTDKPTSENHEYVEESKTDGFLNF